AMPLDARGFQRLGRLLLVSGFLLVCGLKPTEAQLGGRAVGEGDEPIGGAPVHGGRVWVWDPPIGGAPVDGDPVGAARPLGGGAPLEPNAGWDPPIGGGPLYGEPVEENAPLDDESLY